jgi:hypothetical protein
MPTNPSARRVVDTVNELLPDPPVKRKNAIKLRKHREMIMSGCAWEMPVIRPSFPEIGAAIGISHTTVMIHVKDWQAMPWQDRYGWLRLVEGRIASESLALDAVLCG